MRFHLFIFLTAYPLESGFRHYKGRYESIDSAIAACEDWTSQRHTKRKGFHERTRQQELWTAQILRVADDGSLALVKEGSWDRDEFFRLRWIWGKKLKTRSVA